jgi:sulfur-carrier protein
VKILYFASIRERIGKPEEEVEPPASIATVGELMQWLQRRGDEYAYAFDNPTVVRAAVDKIHVQPGAPIANAHEIAFFPPMTGG